jgi:hypothetical protein
MQTKTVSDLVRELFAANRSGDRTLEGDKIKSAEVYFGPDA